MSRVRNGNIYTPHYARNHTTVARENSSNSPRTSLIARMPMIFVHDTWVDRIDMTWQHRDGHTLPNTPEYMRGFVV